MYQLLERPRDKVYLAADLSVAFPGYNVLYD